MDNVSLYSKLTDVFQAVFDDDEIVVTPGLSADDVDGWDSLKHVRLMLSVEKAFCIKFTSSEVGRLKNVGDLASLIQSKI